MIPKYRCDGCNEELGELIKVGAVYILDDELDGLHLMCHNNIKNKIVLCECCLERFEDKLKDEEDWSTLQDMELIYPINDFVELEDLKEYIEECQRK